MSDWRWTAASSIISFIVGFLVRTFIPTSKERFDIKQVRSENSRKLKNERDKGFQEFVKAAELVRGAKQSGDVAQIRDAYWTLRKAGDLYFEAFETIAQYIRRGDIDRDSADNDHFEEIQKIAFKAIPLHYEHLRKISERYDFPLSDGLSTSSFRNIRLFLKGNISRQEYDKLLGIWSIEDPLDR